VEKLSEVNVEIYLIHLSNYKCSELISLGTMHIKTFIRRPEKKKPLGMPRHGWDGDTEINVEQMHSEYVDSLRLLSIASSGGML
jgi:hypothetical protein